MDEESAASALKEPGWRRNQVARLAAFIAGGIGAYFFALWAMESAVAPVVSDELPGVYFAWAPEGMEQLTLNADGTYIREFDKDDGTGMARLKGSWSEYVEGFILNGYVDAGPMFPQRGRFRFARPVWGPRRWAATRSWWRISVRDEAGTTSVKYWKR